MTINELLERMNNGGADLTDIVKIKKYIPIMDKKKLAMDVISSCTDDIDGFVYVDRFKMDIYFDMCIIDTYTDIDINYDFNSMTEQYDILCKNGVFELFKECINGEYHAVKNVFDCVLKDFLIQNSIEMQFSILTNKIINIVDEIGGIDFNNILPNDIDINSLKYLSEIIK